MVTRDKRVGDGAAKPVRTEGRSLFLRAFLASLARACVAGGLLTSMVGSSLAQTTTLLPAGSTWRYLDTGVDPGATWMQPDFPDTSWASGRAILGYGDSDVATVVYHGPDSSQKYITTYFRTTFQVPDPGVYQEVHLGLIRDDGAVVYLNGHEVYRSNLPVSAGYTTLAESSVEGGAERLSYRLCLPPSRLVPGRNVVAVEVHQSFPTSSDLGFDLDMEASASITLWRGPYIQLQTPASAVVRWRTGAPSLGWVRYGTSVADLGTQLEYNTPVTDHSFLLKGLSPSTRYYYAIGTGNVTLAGGDAAHSFQTAPAPGAHGPTRLWVLGDVGTGTDPALLVRDAFVKYAASNTADLMLLLGDNGYPDGEDAEYQEGLFEPFDSQLRNTAAWPTLGNHDARSASSGQQSGTYYDVFTLPRAGEAGGVPSGTEAFYSFDYGQVHMVCLDSSGSDRSAGGPMMTWLAKDLSATTQRWIITFWHHSPYSKGSHDSDTSREMIEMRQAALPILEQYGVDLVLTGHSHSYERSFFLDGHYGLSSTFDPGTMRRDAGDGRVDGDGAYVKRAGPHTGTVYVVMGSSGEIEVGGSLNHPAMFTSLLELGSVVLDISGDRLDAHFLTASGTIADHFTILKETPEMRRASAIAALRGGAGLGALTPSDVTRLDAERGATSEQISILDAVAILRGS